MPQPWADDQPAAGHLRLLSPASAFTMNDSFGNVEKLNRRAGQATITLHPADAAARGLADGAVAMVSNETGAIALQVVTSVEMLPGVALSPKGRWPRLEAADANINVLYDGRKSDMGESTSVHGVEVAVRPLAPAGDAT